MAKPMVVRQARAVVIRSTWNYVRHHAAFVAWAADVAVQTFYLVSGFYMSLILTEKYSHTSSFLTNRVLRLYPAYLAVAAVTLLHSLARWSAGRSAADPGLIAYESHFEPLALGAKMYLVLTNLEFFVVLFRGRRDGRRFNHRHFVCLS